MTARDRFRLTLKCPDCDREGEAQVSENDGYSWMNRRDRRVDAASDGFVVIDHGANHSQETVIGCECGNRHCSDSLA